MRGAIPPLTQYAFMAWCSVKPEGKLNVYLLYNSYFSPRILIKAIERGWTRSTHKENPFRSINLTKGRLGRNGNPEKLAGPI
jgi:hypothetical protein